MKGTIYKCAATNGRVSWRYQIDAGRDEQGNRIRFSKSGFQYRREAEEAMRAHIASLARSGSVGTRSTLAEYLEWWLPHHAETRPLARKTEDRYRSLAAHAVAALGRVRLIDLTTVMLDDFYRSLSKRLAAKTVREVHNVIHVALKRAVKAGLIPSNPADNCELPRLVRREPESLSPHQLAALQAAAQGTWVDLVVRVAAATGARRGEILALRWSDLDWETRRLRIERSLYQVKNEIGFKPTKTHSARIVTLPQSIMEHLSAHRRRQDEDRRLFGPDYHADLGLIFAQPDGSPLVPSSVSRAVVRLARMVGIRGAGLHALRHLHASALLAAGVPVTDISRRLGHRDSYTTLRIYAHAMPGADERVAAIWDHISTSPGTPVAQIGTNLTPRKEEVQ